MTVQSLLYMVTTLKRIQSELRTKELLENLSLTYHLPQDQFSIIQKDFYKLSHPAMDGYEEKEVFQVELLGINLVFIKK